MSHRPQTLSCELDGRCWARLESGDLIGNSGRRPTPAFDRRGRELNGSAIAPGSFSRPQT